MAEDDATSPDPNTSGSRPSFWRRWVIYPLLLILTLVAAAAWIQRKDIADNLIGATLASDGIAASYEIESIGGQRQVLTNIVIGDPAKPDLTIERAEVVIRYRLGLPGVASMKLVKPRLYGTYYGGKLSFGALDPLVFTGSKEPFEFPDMTLDLIDGRALLESEYGPVGIKAEGQGHLRGGFAGKLAMSAPHLAGAGCKAAGATLYGKIGIDAERPQFAGPLRLAGLDLRRRLARHCRGHARNQAAARSRHGRDRGGTHRRDAWREARRGDRSRRSTSRARLPSATTN